MTYFKDPTGNLHFLENEEASTLLPNGCVQILTSEAEAIIAAAERNRQKVYPHFKGSAKLDLFTKEEQLAVVTATMTDPLVKLMYDRLIGAAYLSYEDPETEEWLSLLTNKGLLTPERKVEIVSIMQAPNW